MPPKADWEKYDRKTDEKEEEIIKGTLPNSQGAKLT
jgi:hypothetical protein